MSETTEPRGRPILFSAPMVRAILAGTKTQTRRPLRDGTWFDPKHGAICMAPAGFGCTGFAEVPCPYGKPGDRLWVRETWRHTASDLDEARSITEDIASGTAVDYRATYIDQCKRELGFSQADAEMADGFETWRPSIHMPRWASRITLEVTGVRVERLQDISEADARAEGADEAPMPMALMYSTPAVMQTRYREGFAALWESINGPGSWNANPWVWVVEFKRVKPV